MRSDGWIEAIDFDRTLSTLREEARQDWYRDPWAWAEYGYLKQTRWSAVIARLRKALAARSLTTIVVPKENFGSRPAVVLDILDRICYQASVDYISPDLIGSLLDDVFGWRLYSGAPFRGHYARNDFQWDYYRQRLGELAGHYDVGLKTDVSSFFASLDAEMLVNRVQNQVRGPAVSRLSELLFSWRDHHNHVGIPQRSTASSVLANFYLMPLDDFLADHLGPGPSGISISLAQRGSDKFTRWMDDIWAFGFDEATLRACQVGQQELLHAFHLALNTVKTKIYSGSELVNVVMKIENSAIDEDLVDGGSERLEELIDRLIDEREGADRSAVRFASVRMRDHDIDYRVRDLLEVAPMMPHAAWPLAQLFRRFLPSSEMQAWIREFSVSPWNLYQWTLSQYLFSVPASRRPGRITRELYASLSNDSGSRLALTAAAISRLSAWDPDLTIDIARARMDWEDDVHIRRVLALAAVNAGEKQKRVRTWLSTHEECYLTLAMLEERHFRAIPLPAYLG